MFPSVRKQHIHAGIFCFSKEKAQLYFLTSTEKMISVKNRLESGTEGSEISRHFLHILPP